MSKHIFFSILLAAVFFTGTPKLLTYLSQERPTITYFNPKFVLFVNISSNRYHRQNYMHYLSIHFQSTITAGNNVTMSFYFYQWLTNRYHRSFVEMHNGLCNLLDKDVFLGGPVKKALNGQCPLPPGIYHLANMSYLPEAIPRGFPFSRGRIFLNMSFAPTNEPIARGHIDMELKQVVLRNVNETKTNNKSNVTKGRP